MTFASFSRVAGALLLTTSLAACATFAPKSLSERIEGHVTYFADDALKGRDTGTEGFALAADYVSTFYQRAGIEPTADGYRQAVPLQDFDLNTLDGSVEITLDGEALELTKGEDFFPLTPTEGLGELEVAGEGGLVFIGHGIYAPTLGINDYEGVDVEGKIVLALTGAPAIDDNPSLVHLRRFDVKRKEAFERGAVGFIRIDPNDNMIGAFTRFTGREGASQMAIGDGLDVSRPTAILGVEPTKTLFDASDRDFDEVVADAGEGTHVSFAINATASMVSKVDAAPVDAFNVVGIIPGTDPELAHEAVILTAHLDHIGENDDGDPETDDINNGALDNASGSAIILEVARTIARRGDNRRTVIVAALTAEEKGLLGAAHLARNVDQLGYEPVANVNIDMPVLVYPLNDIIAFGAEYSSMGPVFNEVAAEVDIIATPDPLPQLSLFVRSDHYRFVQEGIPSLFLFNGMKDEGQANFEAFMATHYHRPSDDLNLPINWDDAAKFANITTGLVSRIANDDDAPTWNEGVVFAKEQPEG